MRVRAATTTGIASTGVGFALAGWAVIAVAALALFALMAVMCWVLASNARTSRLARLIEALRGNTPHRTPPTRRNKTLTP